MRERLELDSATPNASDDSGDPRVVAAVKEFMTLADSGRAPARAEFLARHAAIADELAECLDGLEMIEGAARRLDRDRASASQLDRGGPPPVIGDYRIEREIGRGGMGVVYEAFQISLARRVALKILPMLSALDGVRLQRFRIEAQAAASLHHPHIVPVYSVGCEGGIHHYAMQLVEGHSLADVIRFLRRSHGLGERSETRSQSIELAGNTCDGVAASTDADRGDDRRPADVFGASEALSQHGLVKSFSHRSAYYRQIAQLVRQAALALEFAHQRGVVHRDVKPANFLVEGAGHLWVTDFGLAQLAADVELTRTGDALGTLRYMSPEQAAGDRAVIDHRTDVYSLGATMYELLTLEPALAGKGRSELMSRLMDHEPRAPRSIDPQIPAELQTITQRAMAKTAVERYSSAQALADDLGRWLEDKPILAKPPALWDRASKWRRRHRTFVRSAGAAAALAACGLAVAAGVAARAYRREAQQHQMAEASFEQARRAIAAFSELGETELAAKPELRDVRRRLLETSLEYYREFAQSHQDDPAVVAELYETSERIQRIVDELRVLDGSAPLLLLGEPRVQADVELTKEQRSRVEKLLAEFSAERAQAAAETPGAGRDAQRRMAGLLERYEDDIDRVLSDEQRLRVLEIARQQKTPFVFRTSEVVTALELTSAQLTQINEIIEEERVQGHGPPGGGFGGPGHRGSGHGGPPPHEGDGFGPPPHEGDGFGPPGPPPHERHGFGPRGPRRAFGDDWGPSGGSFGGLSDFGPDAPAHLSASKRRATKRILKMLSASQREAWQRLVGRQFPFDLNWGPDNVLPR